MAEPDRAWSVVLDDADEGRDMTTSLLLAIAAELRDARRRRR